MNLSFQTLPLSGAFLIQPKIFKDDRGFFMESFSVKNYQEILGDIAWTHDSLSRSSKGVMRGLHFQKPPFAQVKLVSVLEGEILDVLLDLRHLSPTFGKVFSYRLNDQTREQIFIPVGLAHGFLVVSEHALISYKIAGSYSKPHEEGILMLDDELGLTLPVEKSSLILSEKDKNFRRFKDSPVYF
jgi:dTDP-4-dehydrorhamnose 3,5-epimerase